MIGIRDWTLERVTPTSTEGLREALGHSAGSGGARQLWGMRRLRLARSLWPVS
jgi:hypothetical protein